MMTLPNDVARCDGDLIPIGLHEKQFPSDCRQCIRRTATRPENVQMMQPPEFVIDGECPERIGHTDKGE